MQCLSRIGRHSIHRKSPPIQQSPQHQHLFLIVINRLSAFHVSSILSRSRELYAVLPISGRPESCNLQHPGKSFYVPTYLAREISNYVSLFAHPDVTADASGGPPAADALRVPSLHRPFRQRTSQTNAFLVPHSIGSDHSKGHLLLRLTYFVTGLTHSVVIRIPL